MVGVAGGGSSGGNWVDGGVAAIVLVPVVARAFSSASPFCIAANNAVFMGIQVGVGVVLLGVVVGVAGVFVGGVVAMGVVIVVVVLPDAGVFIVGVDAGAAIFGVTHTLVGGAFGLLRRLNRFLRWTLSCARSSLRICCASAV